MQESKLYKFICKCGRSIEAIGENTEVLCKCRKKMTRADTLHPMTLFRYQHTLSQAALAKLLSVDRSVITKIERGTFVISETLRPRIRAITGLIL